MLATLEAPATVSILVVDDHEIIRQGVIASQNEIGGRRLEWMQAATLDDAATICAGPQPLDGCLLDLNLTDSRGLQGLRRLRELRPSLRIAIFSATEDEYVVGQARALGAVGYVPKSGRSQDLRAALEALVDPRRPWPSTRTPAAASSLANVAHLSPRHLEILELVLSGCSNQEIARSLSLSLGTVKNYVSALLLSLDVRSRAHLIALFR